jgi:hypothetical protein
MSQSQTHEQFRSAGTPSVSNATRSHLVAAELAMEVLGSARHADNHNFSVPRSGFARACVDTRSRIRKLITKYKSGPYLVSEKSPMAKCLDFNFLFKTT